LLDSWLVIQLLFIDWTVVQLFGYNYKGTKMGNCENICDCDVIHQEKVVIAKRSLLDDDTILNVADFFKILSDSTRVKIVSILEKHELCVCDIAIFW